MLRVLTKPLSSSGTAEDEDVLVASAEQDFEPDEVEVEDEGEEEGHAERERDGGADQIGSSSGDEEDMSGWHAWPTVLAPFCCATRCMTTLPGALQMTPCLAWTQSLPNILRC